MTGRIYRSIFFTAMAAVLLALGVALAVFYGILRDSLLEELKIRAEDLSLILSEAANDPQELEKFPAENRITLVDRQGNVLYDSAAQPEMLTNHGDRPEILAAFAQGEGSSLRYSATLGGQSLYYARLLRDGNTVLRVAAKPGSLMSLFWKLFPALLCIVLLTGIGALVCARRAARKITAPIDVLNLDTPMHNETYRELEPLLGRMDKQQGELGEQRREFEAVIDTMREGLLLLDKNAKIVAINRTAAEIFSQKPQACIGMPALQLSSDEEMDRVLMMTAERGAGEGLMEHGGRKYHLYAHSSPGGSAVVLLDITQALSAEESRREFTANVSHELKTPLTSICGYAEIMGNGIARAQDMQGFARKIHSEASRLVALVEDILELSRLEGETALPKLQPVDLMQISQEVCDRLAAIAEGKDVQILRTGESAVVMGDAEILEEMVYNLCDNAIKYNNPQGRVLIHTGRDADGVFVLVEDTGIGIPKEHHEHLFERFYRVDKSHSRKTGGTGLGLSIVKHAAQVHKGTISLQSEENKGTRIRISFPGE